MGRFTHAIGEAFVETLWPTRCFGCDAPGTLLCPACRDVLPVIDQSHACPRCGAPFGALVCTECTTCLERTDDEEPRKPPSADNGLPADDPSVMRSVLDHLGEVRCYGVHAWPLDRVVRGYKDGGERRASRLLALMLTEAALACSQTGAWDAVTFVPCTPTAFARRGGDHMARVAHDLGDLLRIPVADVLARWAPRDQRGLSKAQRAANAQSSIVAVRPLEGARLLVVDDVLTTGATLGAAARALRRAGAAEVDGACVARAW